MPELVDSGRENWGSRAGFILAAVGSAVGLGNLWGFPYKVYANGGGAFLIPYVLAMIVIGIPLLILEFSLGHMTQRAAPDAYRGINRRSEPIGWWGILLGFVIITYYPVILAYCGNYLVECFKSIATGTALPWAGEGAEGVSKAGEYFSGTFLREWTGEELDGGVKPWAFGKLVGPITISLGVMWVLMYLCIFRGVKLVSKVVLYTVPLPWLMLLILTIRGLTLPGAPEGLNFFLDPDWSRLAQPQTWRWAFGQMFFSMSLAFGVMITYASFLHRKSDINNNATIIGLADVATSFVAGIAVFATLGAMAYATRQAGEGVPVQDVALGGPGLAFVAFPYALAQLPYAPYFGAVFFIALLTLGIDSAFSITESVLASLVDKTGWSRDWTLIGLTAVGFGCGLIYCTRGGLAWLGAIDGFINDPWGGIALLGMLECVVVGWAYRIGRLREHANERSDWKLGVWWDVIIRYLGPVMLSALYTWSLLDKFSTTGGFLHVDGQLQVPTLVGLCIAIAAPMVSLVLSFVPSPGADTHAPGGPKDIATRRPGLFGFVLSMLALAGLVYCFAMVRSARLAGVESWQDTLGAMTLGAMTVPAAVVLLVGSVVLAAAGMLTGATQVARSENARQRPSKFARSAAGWGVMTLGGAIGVLLSLWIFFHPPAAAPDGGPAAPASELSGMSYLVLTAMLVLLVVGLALCFLLAIRAAGADADEQMPETGEA